MHLPRPAITVALALSLATPAAALSPPQFIRGDADGSGVIELTDAVVTLNELFLGVERIECDDAADTNDSGRIDLSDAIFGLVYLFLGGQPPPAPFPEPGDDPTLDKLTCGRGSAEDRVLADAVHGGTPAIVVDSRGRPVVVFRGESDSMLVGLREDGVWILDTLADEEGFARSAWRAGIALDPTVDLPVIALDTSSGIELWRADAADGAPLGLSWRLTRFLDDHQAAARSPLAVFEDGTVSLGVIRDLGDGRRQPGVVRDDGEAFEFVPVGEPTWVERMVMALSPSGIAHLAFWEAGDLGWSLRSGSTAREVDDVAPLGSNLLEQHETIEFAVTESDGVESAHFLAPRIAPDAESENLVFLGGERGAGDAHVVASGDPFWESPSYCFEAPPIDGSTCHIDYTRFVPVGVVVDSAGEVRIVYSRHRTFGTVVARCPDLVPQSCFSERFLEIEGDLRAGWIEDGELREVVLVHGVASTEASVAIDGSDSLHVVCNDESDGTRRVRYLEITAPWLAE